MMRISHVLCPVDFSEVSRHALDHAAAIAGWYEARLTVLHVFVDRPSMDLPPLTLDAAARTRLMADLRCFTAHVSPEVSLVLDLVAASAADEAVVERGMALGVDLVVLGTHGRSGLSRLMLGSVAEKVLRHGRCPTLVVPPRAPEAATSGVRFRRILCPIDFSDGALDAATWAIALAEEADAELTLLHVVELPPVVGAVEAGIDLQGGGLLDIAVSDARERLNGLIPADAGTYCRIDTAVKVGRAGAEILQDAAAQHKDLIVMGAHGGALLDRLFGSTTAGVLRRAPCPVLVMPALRGGSR